MEQPELSVSDWQEVYYALEDKLSSPAVQGDSEWEQQLESIMAAISEHITV